MFGRVSVWDESDKMAAQVCHTAEDVRRIARRIQRPVAVPVVRFARPKPIILEAPPVPPRPKHTSAIAACMKVIALMWRETEASKRVMTTAIITAVCNYYGVSRDVIKAPQKKERHIVKARHVAMYLARTMTKRSLPEIGNSLGGRDHTTILHGVRKMEAQLLVDAELRFDIAKIKTVIEGRG